MRISTTATRTFGGDVIRETGLALCTGISQCGITISDAELDDTDGLFGARIDFTDLVHSTIYVIATRPFGGWVAQISHLASGAARLAIWAVHGRTDTAIRTAFEALCAETDCWVTFIALR